MREPDFFNLGDGKKDGASEKKGGGEGLDTPPPPPKLVRKKMFTVTEFVIYPNGESYVSKTYSWFDKAGVPVVKKKVKKKAVKIEQAKLKEEEVY